jgi:hypothetical protein
VTKDAVWQELVRRARVTPVDTPGTSVSTMAMTGASTASGQRPPRKSSPGAHQVGPSTSVARPFTVQSSAPVLFRPSRAARLLEAAQHLGRLDAMLRRHRVIVRQRLEVRYAFNRGAAGHGDGQSQSVRTVRAVNTGGVGKSRLVVEVARS